MSTHKTGFYEDLTKIIFQLSSNIIKLFFSLGLLHFCSLMKLSNNNNRLYFQRVTHLAKYKLIFHEALYYLHNIQQYILKQNHIIYNKNFATK